MRLIIAAALLTACAGGGGRSCPSELPQIMPSLTRRPATGSSLTVRVIDHLTNARIPGSTVIIVNGARRDSAITAANGEINFERLAPGSVSVSVQSMGYRPRRDTFNLRHDEWFDANLRLNPAPLDGCGPDGFPHRPAD